MTRSRRWVVVLAILVFGGSGALVGYLLAPLPPADPPAASEVFAADGRLVARLGARDRVPVPLEQIPEHLVQAVIAIEDRRFFQHFGLDPIGIIRATARNLAAGEVVEGGSTITQQLARTLYLTQDRTLLRKIREALLALKLETHLSKHDILERYLNTIYMGHGGWGMEVAAQVYFGKSVRQVNLSEAAMLAGIIGSPERFSPHRDPELALRRRRQVLERMVELGFVHRAQAAAAEQAGLHLAPAPSLRQEAPYFIDYVRFVLSRELPHVAADLERGGYRIYTTLDLRLQEAAVRRLREGLGEPARQDAKGIAQPQGALVALDPRTGFIRALVGGRDFRESPFNRAYRARRQPGSAFKVFVYTAAIDRGIPVTASKACAPVSYPAGEGLAPYQPVDDRAEQGMPYHYAYLTMRDALRVSDNVVTVRWAEELGPATVAAYAYRLGIDRDTPLEETLPLALGSSAVTPLELARAYAALANLGHRVEPIAVVRVEDAQGNLLYQREPRLEPVLDPGTAYIVTDLLKSVLEPGGTGAHLRQWLPRPAAGKTGTTDGRRSAWFVGYTPELVTVVYVGHDDEQPLPAGGGAIAGPIWARFMADALMGAPVRDWAPPENVVTAAACALTGPVSSPEPQQVVEVFLAGTVPPPCQPQGPPPAPSLPPQSLP